MIWASPTNTKVILQNLEAAVLLKVSIEGDGFFDSQPLHDDEALRVAERVRLVVVGTNQGDGARLIGGADAFDAVGIPNDHVEEFDRIATSTSRPNEEQGVRLDHNGVRCNETPALNLSAVKKIKRSCVCRVLGEQEGDESAGINEDSLHFLSRRSAHASATCLYLSVDTSVKSECIVPASASDLA